MPLTPALAAEVAALTSRTRNAAAAIGAVRVHLPLAGTSVQRRRGPNMRFVIETDGAADLASVRRTVARVLGGAGSLAGGVSWTNRRLTLPTAGGLNLTAGSTFDVRFLFPGADPADQRFKLANFVVLTIPMDPLAVKKLLHGGTGSLYDLTYTIRDAGNYVRVDPEIPAKGWEIKSEPLPSPTPGVPGQPPPPPPAPGVGTQPHMVAL